MKKEFEECLKRKKILPFTRGQILVSKEITSAEHDVERAKKSLSDKDFKWATIQAYYSMFHASRALLYQKNYREKSHYCLAIALRALYIETGQLPVMYVEALVKGKRLREDADYYDEWNNESASKLIGAATEYLKKTKEIVGVKKKSKQLF